MVNFHDPFALIESALTSKGNGERLRGHELVMVTAYTKKPSGQLWVDGIGANQQLVSVRLMTVGEGVEYLLKQQKWQNKGIEYVKNSVKQQFMGGKQNQRPQLNSLSMPGNPLSVGVGGSILFESTVELGMDGERKLLAAYWPTILGKDHKTCVRTDPVHISAHTSDGFGHKGLTISVYADVLDCARARLLHPGMSRDEIRSTFTELLRNVGHQGERINPGIIIRLIDTNPISPNVGKPLRSYDVRCSKSPFQYTDEAGEAKTRFLSADAITTLYEIWKGDRDHSYMRSTADREKAVLRDDLFRIVLSAIGTRNEMNALLQSSLLSGGTRQDAERIFFGIRNQEFAVEIIPYQRLDASKVLRESMRKECADALAVHHMAVQAALRSNLAAPIYKNPYERYTQLLQPGVRGEPLFTNTHFATQIMGEGTATGGVPVLTKFCDVSFSSSFLSINDIHTPNMENLSLGHPVDRMAGIQPTIAPTKALDNQKSLIARAQSLSRTAPSSVASLGRIPKPQGEMTDSNCMAEIRAAMASMCRETALFESTHKTAPVTKKINQECLDSGQDQSNIY